MSTPVFALAFANDRDPDGRYLAGLAEELRGIRAALEPGDTDGRWRIVERANTTLDELLDVFDTHRDNVVALHYGGHAAGYGLLLETSAGHPRLAQAGGLARFLGGQHALRFVCLNGCSTAGQVQDLLAAGVSAVVATEQPIEDAKATAFAGRFYRALAGGRTLVAAFEEARGAVLAGADGGPNTTRGLDTTSDVAAPAADAFPWRLYVADGAAHARDWHLGLATGDPLFGLPPLPPTDLPPEPFRHLQWFAPEHAALFFGRGQETRALYDRVTQTSAPPITLLFGQAGAGKSSLLAAGLTPRLRATHLVAYLRRDETIGLSGVMRKALGIAPDAALPAGAWRALETRLGKPVVIVIDQVEEAFTRPNPLLGARGSGLGEPTVPEPRAPSPETGDDALRTLYGLPPVATQVAAVHDDELGRFVSDLVTLFRDQGTRPQGRLLLGFRKEWLAELRARLQEARLPFGEVFLDRLGRAGIIEAVTGPAREAALRDQYHLAIEDGLAEIVADDLLVDPGAPVAPTLQVLLAKLWQAAKPAGDGTRRFDRALYQPLKDAGILLGDFLDQQLGALGTDRVDDAASGHALDVLAFHTTPHRTAATRTTAELRATYPHRAETLAALVQQCVDLYLLAPAADENGTEIPDAARLAHDTLAPLVRDRADASDRPAQRARRIVESRASEWKDGRIGRLLDDVDLATVESGVAGMRALTADETRLVDASRVAARARWAERLVARAGNEDDPVDAARMLAQLANDPEPLDGRIVASRIARQSLPIAIIDGVRLPNVHAPAAALALASDENGALVAVGGTWMGRLWSPSDATPAIVALRGFDEAFEAPPDSAAIVAPSGGFAAIAVVDLVLTWAMGGDADPVIMQAAERDDADPDRPGPSIMNLVFNDAGDTIVGTTNDTVHVWELGQGTLIGSVPGGGLARVAMSSDARWIGVGGFKVAATLYEVTDDGKIVERRAIADADASVGGLTFDGEGTNIVGKGNGTAVRMWSTTDLAAAPTELSGSERASVFAFNPGYYQLVTGGADGTLRSWFYRADGRPTDVRAHDRPITDIVFAPEGEAFITTSEDGTAKLWRQPLGSSTSTFRGHRGVIRSAAFARDGSWVATVGEGDAVRVWSATGDAEPRIIPGQDPTDGETSFEQESARRDVHVSADGRHMAIASPDGTVRVTELSQLKTVTLRYRPTAAASPECMAVGVADGQVTIVLGDGSVLRASADADAEITTPVRAGGHVVRAADVSRDGRFVALACEEGDALVVRLVALADGAEHDRVLRGADASAQDVAFDVDGGRVMTCASPDAIRMWSTSDANDAGTTFEVEAWNRPPLSADGRQLAAVSVDGVRVWRRSNDGKSWTIVRHVPGARSCAFTPDGRTIVAGCVDGSVVVWPIDADAPTATLRGHRAEVERVQVNGDGSSILSTSRDGSARVWRTDGLGAPLVLVATGERVETASFTADGRRVVTLGDDTVMRLWSIDWHDLVTAIRDRVAAMHELPPLAPPPVAPPPVAPG